MKNIIYLSLTVVFLTTFIVSCTDSFLAENPKGQLTQENFYQSEDDAVAAVNGTYNQLYGIYERLMFLVGDLPADVEKNGLGMPNQYLQNLEFMRYTAENVFVRRMWSRNYSGINRANTAIINISEMDQTTLGEDLKNRLTAELRFLRALFYFNLVRYFGDVPLVTNAETVQEAMIPRTPKNEVYAQIISDLEFAGQHLPIEYGEGDMGRATKGAAKILLGKVHLRRENWEMASATLAEVVENESQYGYGLFENYGDNWGQATETGQEAVFYIEFMMPPLNSNGAGGLQGPKYSVHEGQGIPCKSAASFEADIPTEELYNRFSDDDERKNVTFQTEFYCGDTAYPSDIPLFTKYWDENVSVPTQSEHNFHVIRYADALLMYAEALFEQGNETEALAQINRVRERAFNDQAHNYVTLSREKIWEERLLELAQEGHRWFDLTRQGRFIERMKEHSQREEEIAGEPVRASLRNNIKDYMNLMPIPQREIDVNPELEQNPGWN
ncbi:RagB/SusD family nutrient uptake outer membrane protein [Fodinibius sediminis]|uniref:Starch-binding associating with outer membrane n=1 Tax=Fodinibius sediminis TaxID=1214077 RepID=A0A521DNZ9_9BACT|nr:RagB/SusD family nutrient uptake outer membrane protein [Fodinibius sediminis]SMO73457.1 Starch-binding associating with outer membrane [Fodinibius sediminis]